PRPAPRWRLNRSTQPPTRSQPGATPRRRRGGTCFAARPTSSTSVPTRWAGTPHARGGRGRGGARGDGLADELARALAREGGKTLAEAVGEPRRAAAILRYYGGQTL